VIATFRPMASLSHQSQKRGFVHGLSSFVSKNPVGMLTGFLAALERDVGNPPLPSRKIQNLNTFGVNVR
jgi:hypothetical protein